MVKEMTVRSLLRWKLSFPEDVLCWSGLREDSQTVCQLLSFWGLGFVFSGVESCTTFGSPFPRPELLQCHMSHP